MQLIKLSIHGYKRFQKTSSMNVDGKLIAIIGPNEAGKSSFLKALQHLNKTDGFIRTGGPRELTRGVEIPDDQVVLDATFLLEESDRKTVSHIEDTRGIRWLTVQKMATGEYRTGIRPEPKRDLSRRKDVSKALQKAREVMVENGATTEEQIDLVKKLDTLVVSLDQDDEKLPPQVSQDIRVLSSTFLSSGLAAEIEDLQDLAKTMNALADDEQSTPHDLARLILFEKRPQFLFFDEQARDLQPEYDIEAAVTNPPPALQNLARLADVDLPRLLQVMNEGDHGEIETIVAAANKRLKDVFSTSWSQSSVAVHLRVSDKILHILVSDDGTSFVRIAERSDGLRQYVALLAFVFIEETEQSLILLVDEAETHLHYDAQADLVQMFARQELAKKVIYTTHSIGCLPEDLGTGVRLIEASSTTTSVVQNWFWESDGSGFSPLLFGIGAKTLAYLPVRFALITEGPTDIILLPTMFREATGKAYLGFQVVPGLSVAGEVEVGLLEKGAPRTAYLVDADGGGKNLRAKLVHAGIPDGRIFSLPDAGKQGIMLEDLLDAGVYVSAINEELRRSHGDAYSFPISELPSARRPNAIESWCQKQGIKAPNKGAVAYRVIEQKDQSQILSNSYRVALQQLYADIQKTLS